MYKIKRIRIPGYALAFTVQSSTATLSKAVPSTTVRDEGRLYNNNTVNTYRRSIDSHHTIVTYIYIWPTRPSMRACLHVNDMSLCGSHVTDTDQVTTEHCPWWERAQRRGNAPARRSTHHSRVHLVPYLSTGRTTTSSPRLTSTSMELRFSRPTFNWSL